jgi:hypothetical protein
MEARLTVRVALALFMFVVFGSIAQPLMSREADDQAKIVIVFKDGHQQSFRLADIARIEFVQPSGAGLHPAAPLAPRMSHFLGEWKVGDGTGGTFIITLKPEGKAHKTIGSRDGTWKVADGEARISWDDGWTDVIRRVDGRYQKAAFEPGKSVDDHPSNVAEAEYIEAH